jgi:hypothetical protein
MEVQARGHSQGGLESHAIRNVSAVYWKDDKPYGIGAFWKFT